jgi:hypothetical protein
VIEVLHFGYSLGWIFTAVAVFVVGQRLRDDHLPSPQTVLWSLVAGAIWPLLLVGALQLGATILVSRMLRDEPEPEMNTFGALKTLTKA